MWTDKTIKTGYLEAGGTQIDNCVRLLKASGAVGGVLHDMGNSLKKFPTLTDKQRSFAKSLILKDTSTHRLLAELLNQLEADGVNTNERYVPEDDGTAAAGDDEVEIRRGDQAGGFGPLSKNRTARNSETAKEPEPEVDLVKSPLWGMF